MRVCEFHQELVFRLSGRRGLELFSPSHQPASCLTENNSDGCSCSSCSFNCFLTPSILFFYPIAAVPSLSRQCPNISLSMTRANKSSIIAKVSVCLNSFAFCFQMYLIPDFHFELDLNLNIGQLWPQFLALGKQLLTWRKVPYI